MTSVLSKLRSNIDRAAQCYYYGTPHVTDEQFDSWLKELKKLCPDDQRLTRVGYPVPPDSMLKKHKHTTFTGSLDKCDTEVDFRKWHAKVGGGALVVDLKADGCSLVLYYENGLLTRAVTRGGDNGIGEDVTANAIRAHGVPTQLNSPISAAIRGECVLPVATWKQIDPDEESNPRNLGNGMLRRVTGAGAELLHYYAFDIDSQFEIRNKDKFIETSMRTEAEKLEFLKTLGFNVLHHQLAATTAMALSLYNDIAGQRSSLLFLIDGVVFKVDDIAVQRRLGMSSGRPCGMTVLKFEAEGAETELVGLNITVGHTGALIPTAMLKPVRIGGTTVSNALLNNFDEVEDMDIAIGDRVRVNKMKDIVPKVVSVIDRVYRCPECGFKGTLVQQQEHHGSL